MTEVRFSNGKYYLRDNAVWSADGKKMTKVSSSSATIRVHSPYLGGDEFRFYLNANNGSISMESGEKLYLR